MEFPDKIRIRIEPEVIFTETHSPEFKFYQLLQQVRWKQAWQLTVNLAALL